MQRVILDLAEPVNIHWPALMIMHVEGVHPSFDGRRRVNFVIGQERIVTDDFVGFDPPAVPIGQCHFEAKIDESLHIYFIRLASQLPPDALQPAAAAEEGLAGEPMPAEAAFTVDWIDNEPLWVPTCNLGLQPVTPPSVSPKLARSHATEMQSCPESGGSLAESSDVGDDFRSLFEMASSTGPSRESDIFNTPPTTTAAAVILGPVVRSILSASVH